MIRKKFLIACSMILLNFLIFIGCSKQNEAVNHVKKDAIVHEENETKHKEKNIPINSEIAKSILYNNNSIYIVDLEIFEEFGTSNECKVIIDEDENILIFDIIKATGTVTGGTSGPRVRFSINLNTDEIIEKQFTPAPDYEKLGKTEFIEHGNEVIELSNEKMMEIGKYFEKFLSDIISNQ